MNEEILETWKQIARYMKVSEKTVLRYRKRGLPVTKNDAGHPVITKKTADAWRLKNNSA